MSAEPFELQIRGHDKTVALACGTCGAVLPLASALSEEARAAAYARAREHCTPRRCERCPDPTPGHHLRFCENCRQQWELEKEGARFDKAKKVKAEEWSDPVYWEGHSGSLGDGYFADVDEVLDHCEQEGVDLPGFVWGRKERNLELNAEDVLTRLLESQDYELDEHPVLEPESVEEFQKALDGWVANKRASLQTWDSSNEVAVVFSPE
jgi:hypothetical protein